MADLVRHAVGVDLVELALRFALGEAVPDERRAAAVLAATRDPVPDRVARAAADGPRHARSGSLDPVLEAEGVVQAETYLAVGETIRPVRLDGDRRGYVIATADTSIEALERAEAAARMLAGGGRVSDPRTALVAAGYDAMVDTWEAGRRRSATIRAPSGATSSSTRLAPGAHVVELGCGGGTDETRSLAERFRVTRRRSLGTSSSAAHASASRRRVRPRRSHRARARTRLGRRGRGVLRLQPRPARATRRRCSSASAAGSSRRALARDARRERRAGLDRGLARRTDVLLGFEPETNRRLLDARGIRAAPRRARNDPRARGRCDIPLGARAAMSCAFDLDALRRAARRRSRRRLPVRAFRPSRRGRRSAPAPRRRPLARRRAADGRARGRRGRIRDVLPDDRVGLLQPRLEGRRRRDRTAPRPRPPRRAPRRPPERRARRALRPGRRLAQPGSRRT